MRTRKIARESRRCNSRAPARPRRSRVAAAEIGFDFTPDIGVLGGYRWMHTEAGVSDVNFGVTIQRPYAGLEVRF